VSVQASPIEEYLAKFSTCVPSSPVARDMLDEARDHLVEGALALQSAGASRQAAERDAVREFGSIEQLAVEFRTVIMVRDAKRQARWQLVVVGLLGICGFSAFRLIPLWRGQLSEIFPPPLVACAAAAALLCPSLVLLMLSATRRTWHEARWTAWLLSGRTVASWLFVLGLPACASMVADQIAVLVGAPHAWLLAGLLGGLLLARRVVPETTTIFKQVARSW